jgi:citrate/tricarballylate utilization protein
MSKATESAAIPVSRSDAPAASSSASGNGVAQLRYQPLASLLDKAEAEVAREMAICNACRYCEGFCAVFPAMERRLDFAQGDVHFLANLCHNCGACLYACQYAPPHPFAVNLPKALAEVRAITYETYAWPASLGALYRHQGAWLALLLVAGIAAFFLLAMQLNGGIMTAPATRGRFYDVVPHWVMATPFLVASAWIVVAFGIGVTRFWRGLPARTGKASHAAAAAEATQSALTLRYLDGGGDGCNDRSDAPSRWRRRFHHATFYGFMLCFAATCVATFYHFVLKQEAPYPLLSIPVILGTVGGVGLLVGTAGLMGLNLERNPLHGDHSQRTMDMGFMLLLFITGLTGLLLLGLRDTQAMPPLLALHLGVVIALFITLPYGKFAHAVYRVAALFKDAVEKRQRSAVALAPD